ncbi:hypothetical protein BKA57DRAFT_462700 [Linnemannia elongata]|nr:hypothetical protein BKA57DRAFT_462700 [Linnemannia elongata]
MKPLLSLSSSPFCFTWLRVFRCLFFLVCISLPTTTITSTTTALIAEQKPGKDHYVDHFLICLNFRVDRWNKSNQHARFAPPFVGRHLVFQCLH